MIKRGILTKTIPTLLGILLLAAGLIVGFFLVKNQPLLTFKEGGQILPKNVTLTNITANGFTVSWLTQEATLGFLQYGEEEKKLNQKASDYRDKISGENKNYFTHYVNVEGLEPQKKYYFKIGSGSKNFLYDNLGKPYEVTTGPNLGSQPPQDIIYGKVVTKQQQPVEGAIVYLTLANGSPLSALTGKDGMWAKSLQTMRTSNLDAYLAYDREKGLLNLKATAGLKDEDNATVVLLTKSDKPTPTIVLGKNEDYSQEVKKEETALIENQNSLPAQFPLSPEATPSNSEKVSFSNLAELENLPPAQPKVSINNPSREDEKLNTLKPQFFGQGPAGKTLTLEIQSSKKYSATVIINKEGYWQYTPPEELTPGNHLLTLSFIDENGREQKLSRHFTIVAQGLEQYPAFEASPSASTSPSPTPNGSPLSRVTIPATEGGIPKPGSVGPTFLVFLSGLLFLIVGFFWQREKKC